MDACTIWNVGQHGREPIGPSNRTRHDTPSLGLPSLVLKSHRSNRHTIANNAEDRGNLSTEVEASPKIRTPHLPGCLRECRTRRGGVGTVGAKRQCKRRHEYHGDCELYEGGGKKRVRRYCQSRPPRRRGSVVAPHDVVRDKRYISLDLPSRYMYYDEVWHVILVGRADSCSYSHVFFVTRCFREGRFHLKHSRGKPGMSKDRK